MLHTENYAIHSRREGRLHRWRIWAFKFRLALESLFSMNLHIYWN